MKMLVLGDSVCWGQGLLPQQKFSTLVYQGLFGQAPVTGEMRVLAHSGAIIGASAHANKPAVDGEVPDSYRTIRQQCADFTGATDTIKLVLVNGGINDVDAFTIVNPLTDEDDLRDMIQEYCYRDMLTLLDDVTRKFSHPQTTIVVPSYFPILSAQSDPLMLPSYLGIMHNINLDLLTTLAGDIVFAKIFRQCKQFYEESSRCLAKAVADTNARLGGTRLRYAQVPFTDANAALAPQAWLWGITEFLLPEDPVQDARHNACNRDEPDALRRQICYRASAGHPNLLGAQEYAKAIRAVLA
ncbi:MAG: hypothetical protein V4463_13970 [Pseudomonadota bacterium]